MKEPPVKRGHMLVARMLIRADGFMVMSVVAPGTVAMRRW